MAYIEHQVEELENSCKIPINWSSHCISKPLWLAIGVYSLVSEHVGIKTYEYKIIQHWLVNQEYLIAENEIRLECITKL